MVGASILCLNELCFALWILIFCLNVVPEGAPIGLNVAITSSTSAYLTWNPPSYEEQNGVIIEYVINVTVQETGERFQLTSNTTYLEVTTLRPYRTYMCIVAAATSVGLGPFSTSVTVKTPEDGKNLHVFMCTIILCVSLYTIFCFHDSS